LGKRCCASTADFARGGYTLYSWSVTPILLPLIIVSLMVGLSIYKYGAASFSRGFKETFTDWHGNPFRQKHWDIRFVALFMGLLATIQFVLMSNFSITGPQMRIGAVALSLIFGEEMIFNNTYLNGLFADFPRIGLGPEETLIIFLVIGSFVAALLSGSFKIRMLRSSRLPYAIGGGLIMGIASRIAPGCNIANVITGIGGLSISSFLVVIGMMIGIFIVVAYVFRMPLLLFQRNHVNL
jgi:hypothetical protein